MNGIGAFIAGPRIGPGEGLADISNDVGFAFVSRYDGIAAISAQMRRTPLCFVLFGEVANPAEYGVSLRELRTASVSAIRFLPLVYFCESPSPEIIARCMSLGFDDVLTMPFTPERITKRLSLQIGQAKLYFRTSDYFGPDRRVGTAGSGANRNEGGMARKYEILRSAKSGVSILREELVDTRMRAGSAA